MKNHIKLTIHFRIVRTSKGVFIEQGVVKRILMFNTVKWSRLAERYSSVSNAVYELRSIVRSRCAAAKEAEQRERSKFRL